MKFHKNKFLTTVAAIALALAVGACSSSSDDDEMAGTPPVMDGDGDADAMNGDGDATNGDDDAKTPAQTLAAAEKALTDASTDEDRAEAMTALEAALKLEGNEAEYLAYLEKKVVDQAQTVADATAKAAKDERIAREEMIRMAIDASTNAVVDNAIAMPAIDDVTGVTAERAVDGTVTVALTGVDDFTGGEANAGDGWTSTMLTRANDDSDDIVVVYTDVEAPTPTTIGDEATMGSIAISDADHRGRVVPTELPSGAADLRYEENDEFKGTYRGVAGTFQCTSTNCTVSLDDEKTPMLGDNDMLSFVPDRIGDTYGAPDTAYAYFGWWLNKPAKAGDPHMVEVFSGSSVGNDFPTDGVGVLEGKATYSGSAAGKYATRTFSAGALTDAQAGHFTAAATLTADFDADSDSDADGGVDTLGTIGGTVTGFEASDGVDASAWKVTLGTAPLSSSTATFNGMTDVDFGGGKEEMAGDWQGSFYTDTDTDTDATDDAPGTVAGTFRVTTSGASLLGGFGATKQ